MEAVIEEEKEAGTFNANKNPQKGRERTTKRQTKGKEFRTKNQDMAGGEVFHPEEKHE